MIRHFVPVFVISKIQRAGVAALLVFGLASSAAVVVSFPWDTDPRADESIAGASVDYYRRAYSLGVDSKDSAAKSDVAPLSAREQSYVDFARAAAKDSKVPEQVTAFVTRYRLAKAKVLDVGAGSGLLQDVVQDYTGLDISHSARRFFHKRFVEASATDMPFQRDSFDALWSIWVLEHIPNPEKALMEMRRVVRPGGYIFLWPAYEVDDYAAQGYRVRPYSEFDLKGKLVKATTSVTSSSIYKYLHVPQIRVLRLFATRLGSEPSRFRFRRLTPNYEQYWVADSDATTSFTRFELCLWFASRGDRILESPPLSLMVLRRSSGSPVIVQVRKSG